MSTTTPPFRRLYVSGDLTHQDVGTIAALLREHLKNTGAELVFDFQEPQNPPEGGAHG